MPKVIIHIICVSYRFTRYTIKNNSLLDWKVYITTDLSNLRTTWQAPSSIWANFPINLILLQLSKTFRKLRTTRTQCNRTQEFLYSGDDKRGASCRHQYNLPGSYRQGLHCLALTRMIRNSSWLESCEKMHRCQKSI
jgi:hypothetical protein